MAQETTNWPQFRGPAASGVAEGAETPLTWNIDDGANVLWKTAVAGLGHSSPVIWGDRIYLTTAIDAAKEPTLKLGFSAGVASSTGDAAQTWKVMAFDKSTGKLVWEKTAHQGMPKSPRHPKATFANPTVATDGEHLVAFFGSEGLYCYDMDGSLLWKKDLGLLDSGFFTTPGCPVGLCRLAGDP